MTYTVTTAASEDIDDLISAINGSVPLAVTASVTNGAFTLTADNNTVGITVAGTGTIAGVATQAVPTAVYTQQTVDELVSTINANTNLNTAIRASNDNGKLRIENLSTADLTVTGVGTDDTGCGWVDVDLSLSVGDRTCTTGHARVAVPINDADNPWARRGDDWRPFPPEEAS